MTPATFYVVVGGNDIYWRVLAPAKAIGAQVVRIDTDDANEYLIDKPEVVYGVHEGTGVWTRPDTIRARHALGFEEHGLMTVAELDDNYLSPVHQNIFMRVNKYGEKGQQAHLRAVSTFQRVVFSTEWLRDRYHKALKKQGGHVPELHVCQNHVDLDDWPNPVPGDRLRVGWMGSAQHARDIKLAFSAFAWASDAGLETVLMGNDVRDEEGVSHPRAIEACRAWRKVITTHIPWTKPEEYHRTALPLDIGLAPVELNDHTMGKSDVKALEYVVSGAVPVLQNHPIYSKHWRHLETAVLAGSPVEFRFWVERLAKDPKMREEILANGQQYVRENRTMQTQGKAEWEAAVGV